MKNGFIKVAAATPTVRVADTVHNAEELVRLATEAASIGVRVLVFPELCLTGATCGDLFTFDTLIRGAQDALKLYLAKTAKLDLLSVVGLPYLHRAKLYNVAAVCHAGKLLGLVPKTVIGASDARQFSSPSDFVEETGFDGEVIPFGKDLLFSCSTLPSLTVAVELGEELCALRAPSIGYSAAGATLICHPAAFPETVGNEPSLETILAAHSSRTKTAYVSALCGYGESTTDLAFGGRKTVVENGAVLASTLPFEKEELLCTEIDTERLTHDQRTLCSDAGGCYTEIPFALACKETALTRKIDAHPFFPTEKEALSAHCERILAIQTAGLMTRIERAYAKKIVVGISGGLDSTLALLVMVRAIDALKRPRTDVLAVTMPCFGTSARTKNNATVLCEELGVDFRCVDIFDAVNVHFKDIGHDSSVHDVTYENAQARERTQVLMDIANECGGMVIGTGDLSELALGWATYNGDHMSMYGVNASIPKTLMRHIVAHCADRDEKIAAALRDILDTPVSPELLPADTDGTIAQKTEDLVGPYELHDFYLYYLLRYGFSPKKLYRMAKHALGKSYDDETLKKWLKTFVRRFFTQQFKRSCLPDGPRVGEISLSPRGAWSMPSDAVSALWQKEAEEL
ncbi:MAG: NAD(+) synthase [Clostridia bacterium]|nr:NAD(+) synthase [Clostridia bacterium]